jgi:hypothetical protein
MQNQRFSKALNPIFGSKDFEPPHLPSPSSSGIFLQRAKKIYQRDQTPPKNFTKSQGHNYYLCPYIFH